MPLGGVKDVRAYRRPTGQEVEDMSEHEEERLPHDIGKGFKADRIFGDPIKLDGDITIIPVAKAKFGGGGGGGGECSPQAEEGGAEGKPGGFGKGFGFKGGIKPLGYIEIKEGKANWVRIHDWEKLAVVIPLCLLGLGVVKLKIMWLEKVGSMAGRKPCRKCGMHHMGPCPMHAAMMKHRQHTKQMKHMKHMRHAGGHCPICGMHHSGPCPRHKKDDPKEKKAKRKQATST